MGVRINFDACPRECLSATQLQWARCSATTPIHANVCPAKIVTKVAQTGCPSTVHSVHETTARRPYTCMARTGQPKRYCCAIAASSNLKVKKRVSADDDRTVGL